MPYKYQETRNAMRRHPIRLSTDNAANTRLQEQLKQVADDLRGQVMEMALKKLGQDIRKEIWRQQNWKAQYTLEQSGQLKREVGRQRPKVQKTDTGLRMTLINLSQFNERTLRREQTVRRRYRGGRTAGTVTFKAEKHFPSWVAAEFGIGSLRDSTANLSRFGIAYSAHPNGRGPYRLSRPTNGEYRKAIMPNILLGGKHGGVRAAHIFSSAVFVVRKAVQNGQNQRIPEALKHIFKGAIGVKS